MAEVIYRAITEADYPRFAQISGEAFNYTPDATSTAEELANCRGLFVGGELVAQLGILAFRMRTGVADVPCLGLGGVASPPEQRRRGHVATLLREVCDEARATGTSFCMLHPFKESFYRRFGWTNAMERRNYTCAPALLSSFRQIEGGFVRVGPDAFAELDQIYTHGLRGRYGVFMRDQKQWQEIMSHQRHCYVWRDSSGTSRAYIVYKMNNTPKGRRMVCRELVALDPLARSQLFAFLANHDSQCFEIEFAAPTDAPVNLLMPDSLGCEVQPWGMLRLLDIPGALAGYAAPRDLVGSCTIAVHDDWLAHNNGTFALEVIDGSVTCVPSTDAADLSMDVRVLTQLMTRYLRPRTAAAFGMLEVQTRPALALLDTLFAGLAPFNSDDF